MENVTISKGDIAASVANKIVSVLNGPVDDFFEIGFSDSTVTFTVNQPRADRTIQLGITGAAGISDASGTEVTKGAASGEGWIAVRFKDGVIFESELHGQRAW